MKTTNPSIVTKIHKMWKEGKSHREMLKELPPIDAQTLSDIKEHLDISGPNPNLPKKESKYGISPSEDKREWYKRRYRAKYKERTGDN